MYNLDSTDKLILNILQDDATLPLKRIAERAHVSVATAQRRITQLADAKVITKQVALLDPIKVGYDLSVIVMIKMRHTNTRAQKDFERLMANTLEIASCFEISGEYDFLLMIYAKNMQDYHRLSRDLFTLENNVASFNSQFVMNFVKRGSKIELQ